MIRRTPPLTLLFAVAAAGCMTGEAGEGVEDEPNIESTEQEIYSDVGGLGPFNGIEWQIDAPWRLEPSGAKDSFEYDAIPLVVTFADVADQLVEGATDTEPLQIEHFCGLYVVDQGMFYGSPATFIPPEAFHEIEGQRSWLPSGFAQGPDLDGYHQLYRVWERSVVSTEMPERPGPDPDGMRRPETIDDVLTISDWSEWNAVALYDPVALPEPGEDLDLIVLARVSRGRPCDDLDLEMTGAELMLQVAQGRVSEHPVTGYHATSLFFADFLKVHYAEAPLPRFSEEWVYGDLHYHSQGTDNEGEMGVSYRGTIQAMKAMGLDYAFATEHASGGAQLTAVARWGIDSLRDLFPEWVPDDIAEEAEEWIIDWLNNSGYRAGSPTWGALRDMSADRFRHLHWWLNAANGVNAEVGASGGSEREPQIFLGGEVDAVPVVSEEDALAGGFHYGNDGWYWYDEPCYGVPDMLIDHTDFEVVCSQRHPVHGNMVSGMLTASDVRAAPGADYAINDVQGPLETAWARQHLIFLPKTAREDAFVASETSTYGGANRFLNQIIEDDLRRDDKGYAFLAHPIASSGGTGFDRIGPDIVPYSEMSLMTAFAADEVLGLQLWNEDARYHTKAAQQNFPMLHNAGSHADPEFPDELMWHFDWDWAELEDSPLLVALHQGATMWDQVLLWGITPARLEAAGKPTNSPRKFYMAGGSDAHGDLNYRREGRFLGWDKSNDTAIGKPRNLTFVGRHGGKPSQEQVIGGLVSGQFSVTDGPALRIAVDTNGNGVIDDDDVPMGGDFAITGATVPLLVEWKSTEEFGGVDRINLYVGVQAEDHEGLVYAPQEHAGLSSQCIADAPMYDGSGFERCVMKDGYVRDETGLLTLEVEIADRMTFTKQFDLDPNDYPLFDTECRQEVAVVDLDDGTTRERVLTFCDAVNVQSPERLYIRAFAQTDTGTVGLRRYAFTNPIWMTSEQVASAPLVDITHRSCSSGTNTFDVSVAQGTVPGTISQMYRVGSGFWAYLMGSTITAPGGQTVSVAARACNEHGCSDWAIVTRGGPTCEPPPPPPPSAPGVKLEYTGCRSGVNGFLATVWKKGTIPVSYYNKQYKIGTGSWKNLTSSTINAGSRQRVYLRARACNADGCSSYASTSYLGPYCGTGGVVLSL